MNLIGIGNFGVNFLSLSLVDQDEDYRKKCSRSGTSLLLYLFTKLVKKTCSDILQISRELSLTLEGGSKLFPSFSWSMIFRFAEERVGYRRFVDFEVAGVSSSIRGLLFCFVHDRVATGIIPLHLRRTFFDYKYIDGKQLL